MSNDKKFRLPSKKVVTKVLDIAALFGVIAIFAELLRLPRDLENIIWPILVGWLAAGYLPLLFRSR